MHFSRPILLEVTEEIELDKDIILPPGSYDGLASQTELRLHGGTERTTPKFSITLSAEELADMGHKVGRDLIEEQIDVSLFVQTGKILVS